MAATIWDSEQSIYWFVLFLKRYMLSDEEEHRQLMDLIEKMLEYDPDKRITLATALEHEFFNLIPTNQRHEDDPILRNVGPW